jgi:hypothetical protein
VLTAAGAAAAQPPPAQLIVSPVEGPDNIARLAHSGPYTVQFIVTNTGPGPDDADVDYDCVLTGNVTLAANGCPFNSIIPPQGDPAGNADTVFVSFFVTYAGIGEVRLNASVVTPVGGQGGTGSWDILNIVAAGATVTPSSVTTSVARGATGSNGFTVANTTAPGLAANYTLRASCPSGFSNCLATPGTTGTLQNGASIAATVQYTAPTSWTQSQVTFEVVNGPQVVTAVPLIVTTVLGTVDDAPAVTVPPSAAQV